MEFNFENVSQKSLICNPNIVNILMNFPQRYLLAIKYQYWIRETKNKIQFGNTAQMSVSVVSDVGNIVIDIEH